MKAKTKKNIITYSFGIISIVLFYIATNFVIKRFSNLVALTILDGYKKIFMGNTSFAHVLTVVVLILVIFIYVASFVHLYLLTQSSLDLRGGIVKAIRRAHQQISKKYKNLYFLILTIIISLVVMYSGSLFLSTAFPAETLYTKGVKGTSNSTLKCNGGQYLNIIDAYDQPCTLGLSSEFNASKLMFAQVKYTIKRKDYIENVSTIKRNFVNLYYDKIKQPGFLYLHFNDSKKEMFVLNTNGVYSKEEYFDREKEKAVWFFGIISFSIFSIFSAMANFKRILGWK